MAANNNADLEEKVLDLYLQELPREWSMEFNDQDVREVSNKFHLTDKEMRRVRAAASGGGAPQQKLVDCIIQDGSYTVQDVLEAVEAKSINRATKLLTAIKETENYEYMHEFKQKDAEELADSLIGDSTNLTIKGWREVSEQLDLTRFNDYLDTIKDQGNVYNQACGLFKELHRKSVTIRMMKDVLLEIRTERNSIQLVLDTFQDALTNLVDIKKRANERKERENNRKERKRDPPTSPPPKATAAPPTTEATVAPPTTEATVAPPTTEATVAPPTRATAGKSGGEIKKRVADTTSPTQTRPLVNPSLPNAMEAEYNKDKYAYMTNLIDTNDIDKLAILVNARPECVRIRGGSNDYTALLLAAVKCNLPLMKLLIENGANGNDVNKDGSTILHLCARYYDHVTGVGYIVKEYPHLVHQGDKDKRTPLHYTALNGRLASLKVLLEAGAKVNEKDAGGRTPLDRAKVFNKTDCIAELTKWGGTSRI